MWSSGVVARGLQELRVGFRVVVCGLRGCGGWSSGVMVCGLQESWHVVFRGCDFQAVWQTGSVTLACGIFPDQRSNPCLLHWRVDEPPRKPPQRFLTFENLVSCG